jgi:membrane dipeptidase
MVFAAASQRKGPRQGAPGMTDRRLIECAAMNVRTGIAVLGLASSLVTGVVCSAPKQVSPGPAPASVEARAEAILRTGPVFDGHNDLAWEMRTRAHYNLDRIDLRQSQPELMTDIGRLRAGHVGAQFWSVYVPARLAGRGAVTATLEQMDFVHQLVRRYPDTFELAATSQDVERAFASGRIGSMMGVEGGHSIDSSLATLRTLYRLGGRYMTLTHSRNVPWADSATDEPKLGGLSRFGEAVVAEMNWLGMLADLSHVSVETMDDVLRVTQAPVIFSHSSARAICDVPRNVPDSVLKQLPKNGGVVMVSFVPSFTAPGAAAITRAWEVEERRQQALHPNDDAAVDQAMKQWEREHPEPPATLAQVADHIDHVRNVAGIDHVGLGSDFDGISNVPSGLEDVSKFPALIAELLRRGYSDEDVRKVTNGNVLRALREAERVAARLQSARGPSNATIQELDGR